MWYVYCTDTEYASMEVHVKDLTEIQDPVLFHVLLGERGVHTVNVHGHAVEV